MPQHHSFLIEHLVTEHKINFNPCRESRCERLTDNSKTIAWLYFILACLILTLAMTVMSFFAYVKFERYCEPVYCDFIAQTDAEEIAQHVFCKDKS